MRISYGLLTTLVLLCLNLHVCDSISPAYSLATSTICAVAAFITSGKFFWELPSSNTASMMLSIQSNKIQSEVLSVNKDILKTLNDLPEREALIKKFETFEGNIATIEKYYKDMLNYYRNNRNVSSYLKDNMIKMSSNVLLYSSNDGPIKLMYDVMDLLAFGSLNILDKLQDTAGTYASSCSRERSQTSSQLTLYHYLNIVQLAMIKVIFTLHMAFDILNYHDKSNSVYINSSYHNVMDNLKESNIRMIKKYQSILPSTSRTVWRCDPEPLYYKEDVTYIKLKHVFQGHIRNQRDIQIANGDPNGMECSGSCDQINPTRDLSCMITDSENGWIKIDRPTTCEAQRKCSGELWDCQEEFKNRDSVVKICLSTEDSDRGYDFVETYLRWEPIRYGQKNSACKRNLAFEENRDWFVYGTCYVCYCICDDEHFNKTERMFYTKSVVADVSENYVITGARFRKEKGVIYIQIQQGKLLNTGYINETTVQWKQIPEADLMNPANHFRIRWSAKSIELQDIDIPQKHVLVGIRFENVTKDAVTRLRLVALSQFFNFTDGKLNLTEREFESRTELSSIKSGIDVRGLKLPDDKRIQNNIIVTEKYLIFSISNLESDLGQTTIPFIDTQDVTTNIPFPMSAIGLYYRKSLDDSVVGFIGLKLKTYDFSQDVNNYLLFE